MHDSETFFVFSLCGRMFVYALYMRFRRRELQHKERMAAIEKGVTLPDLTDVETGPRIYLLRGLIWLLSGIALSVFLSSCPRRAISPDPSSSGS
jgi:hypothetical protein